MDQTIKKIIYLFLFIAGVSAPARAADVEMISVFQSTAAIGVRTSYHPSISGDGRFVVFESRDTSIPLHKNKFRDIFFYDREKHFMKKVEPANMQRSNSSPFISDSGRFLVYQSYPLSAVLGQPPLVADVYVYDRFLDKSTLQTFGRDVPTDGEAVNPILSSDARYLVFTSNATIYPGLKNAVTRQVYIYDHQSREFELVSKSVVGDPGNRPSADPRVSQNGRFVAFKSAATNLIRLLPLESLETHLYLLDRTLRSLIQIDDPALGFDTDKWMVGRYDMDRKGQVFVFEGRQRKIDDPLGTISTLDLFLFDKSIGTVRQLTSGIFASRSHSPTLSGDGRFVGFVFKGLPKEKIEDGLIVYDIKNNAWRRVIGGSCANPRFSADGHFIAYQSDQEDPRAEEKSKVDHIFVATNPFMVEIDEDSH